MKILISAYANHPFHGSEHGVGWSWSRMVSGNVEHLIVLCAEQHKTAIDSLKASWLKESLIEFIYIRRRRLLWLENIFPPAYLWTYNWWLKDAYTAAETAFERTKYDLVHQLTYVGFRVPGHLWKLDVPFVWGPIGGLENTPWRFLPEMGWYGALYFGCRNVINTLQKMFLPGPKRAFAKAARTGSIIAATEGIRKEIKKWYGYDSTVICEIGPPGEIASDYTRREPGEPLRLAWSGLHLPGKALPLLLKALVGLNLDWRLTVLGAGPLTDKWRRLAQDLGIASRIDWTGKLPRDEAVRRVHDAHLFVITSLKDLTSTVLLEALSQGVPVVCPEHCGFSNVVTEECGIKVPLQSPRQLVRDLGTAVRTLAEDERRRRQLAAGALRRIQDFTWEKKAAMVEQIYQTALQKWQEEKRERA